MKSMNLPKDFLDEMQSLLNDDYEKYINTTDNEPFRGISVNRIKTTPEKLLPLLPFDVQKSPFYDDGYYIPSDVQGIGNLPLHHSGAFYVQEPSAMSAVELLDVQKGDQVLDLCAAPGGKSLVLAGSLDADQLERELKKTDSIVKIGDSIIRNGELAFKTMQHMDQYGYSVKTDRAVPPMLETRGDWG